MDAWGGDQWHFVEADGVAGLEVLGGGEHLGTGKVALLGDGVRGLWGVGHSIEDVHCSF